jgi:hypothetical protein
VQWLSQFLTRQEAALQNCAEKIDSIVELTADLVKKSIFRILPLVGILKLAWDYLRHW